MQISTKFNIGDEVYYPAADLERPAILKSAVARVVVGTGVDGKEFVSYNMGGSYGVRQEDVFKTPKPAKRRLIAILKLRKKEIDKEIDNAVKKIESAKTKELVTDLTHDEKAE